MDQQYNVIHLKQSPTENEPYIQLEKWNLSAVDEFRSSLDRLSQKNFVRVGISRRCMTIKNKTCVLETNHVYDSLSRKIIDDLPGYLTCNNRESVVVSS